CIFAFLLINVVAAEWRKSWRRIFLKPVLSKMRFHHKLEPLWNIGFAISDDNTKQYLPPFHNSSASILSVFLLNICFFNSVINFLGGATFRMDPFVLGSFNK